MGQTEIETLRQIPLEDFLARLGHEPIRRRGNEWWYVAPYRTERTPSLRVNVDKQLWYDFGLVKGGDIFTLAGEFVHSCDFMEQAKFITEASIVPLPQTEPRPHKAVGKKPAFEEVKVRALSHRALLSYLEERGVASAIAGRHCKEVHFRLNGKRYFAIGFGNRSGGFELRNRFFQGLHTAEGHHADEVWKLSLPPLRGIYGLAICAGSGHLTCGGQPCAELRSQCRQGNTCLGELPRDSLPPRS